MTGWEGASGSRPLGLWGSLWGPLALEAGDTVLEVLDVVLKVRPGHEIADGAHRIALVVQLDEKFLRRDSEHPEDGEDLLQLEVGLAIEELGEIALALVQGTLDFALRALALMDGFPQGLGETANFDFRSVHGVKASRNRVVSLRRSEASNL